MPGALGNFEHSPLPLYGIGGGVRTTLGTNIPPGGQVVAYVRASPVSGDDNKIEEMRYSTLNAALNKCRSGAGDIVIVLPGHAENISTADQMSNLVAGTRIIGLGQGTSRPTFTWTAAGSTFLFDVANVSLHNCILEMAGPPGSTTALSVAAPITVSAAGCAITNCLIRTSVDADQLATVPIKLTDAADDCALIGLRMYGATAGESTTMVDVLGADRLLMEDCVVMGATSSTTVGVMRFAATAATDIVIRRSTFVNRKAASVHAVTGVAALSGVVSDCDFGILNDSLLVAWVTKGDLMFYRCQVVNLAGETGGAATPVST